MTQDAEVGAGSRRVSSWTVPYTVQPPPGLLLEDAARQGEEATSGKLLSAAASEVRQRCVDALTKYFVKKRESSHAHSSRSPVREKENPERDNCQYQGDWCTHERESLSKTTSPVTKSVGQTGGHYSMSSTADVIDVTPDTGFANGASGGGESGRCTEIVRACRQVSETLQAGMCTVNAYEQACARVEEIKAATRNKQLEQHDSHDISKDGVESEYSILQRTFNDSVSSSGLVSFREATELEQASQLVRRVKNLRYPPSMLKDNYRVRKFDSGRAILNGTDMERVAKDDTIYRIVIEYNAKERRNKMCTPAGSRDASSIQAMQEFLVLGSQYLTELKDEIDCNADRIVRYNLSLIVRYEINQSCSRYLMC